MPNSPTCAKGQHEWCYNRSPAEANCKCACHAEATARRVAWLYSREFYDVMQEYRHHPLTPQSGVVDAFEAVKTFIRARL